MGEGWGQHDKADVKWLNEQEGDDTYPRRHTERLITMAAVITDVGLRGSCQSVCASLTIYVRVCVSVFLGLFRQLLTQWALFSLRLPSPLTLLIPPFYFFITKHFYLSVKLVHLLSPVCASNKRTPPSYAEMFLLFPLPAFIPSPPPSLAFSPAISLVIENKRQDSWRGKGQTSIWFNRRILINKVGLDCMAGSLSLMCNRASGFFSSPRAILCLCLVSLFHLASINSLLLN